MSALRERRDDFATETGVPGTGVSLDRRPDAVAWDYRTAFAPGPRAVGDPSAGLLDRAWRAVADDGAVRLARADDTGTAWEAETVLFTYTGAPIVELGLAFDQNGGVVACAERATGAGDTPQVWLYRYDSAAAAYVFSPLGAGRTPRLLLDEPHGGSESDVLLFYVSDAADAVVYRQQRDHYAAEHPTPVTGAAECRLEAAGWDREGRVRLVASRRNPATGTWALEQAASALYPLRTSGALDPLGFGSQVVGLAVRQTVLTPVAAPEGGAVQHTLRGVVVADPTIRYVSEGDPQAAATHVLQTITVRPLVFRVDVRDPAPGGASPAHRLLALQVQTLVVTHRQPADTGGHLPSHAVAGIQVRPLIHVLPPTVETGGARPAHTLLAVAVRALIRTQRQPADAEQALPGHTLSSIAVAALIHQARYVGEPSLPENQHVPTHAVRSIAVGP